MTRVAGCWGCAGAGLGLGEDAVEVDEGFCKAFFGLAGIQPGDGGRGFGALLLGDLAGALEVVEGLHECAALHLLEERVEIGGFRSADGFLFHAKKVFVALCPYGSAHAGVAF